ncbi:DegT/DnrJ/EryC1/StrS aminotransferase family protein [Clostridium sp. YIM B02551]|uniref:DegT/DnrJ/EryC1/StrS family aminotransferase n=1 Tax=Clostridium sp. YIM B02551 TaxID=2910679 RepID=UPI001EECA20B|nr:DegT/DnrJ/EryC1/StrS family aminotransferase [Clostridium sp. YIM B02551]
MINVTKTYLPKKENYFKYVDKIYENGWLTNNGPLLQEFESRLKDFLGVKNILLVSNGTLALQIAYKALELKGEVLTTPFTFVATTSSIVWEGLTPKFIDINPKTLNIDEEKIEEYISKDTCAIVPVHVFGNPANVRKIDSIAKKHNIKVIYDAAHAFDVKLNNQSILNFGDISTLSFHSTKIFHSIEGGALIINDDEIYKKAKRLINFGMIDKEKIAEVGINAKMNEFQAAMGLCVLDEYEQIVENRKKVYEYYKNKLKADIEYPIIDKDISWNYSYFPVIFRNEKITLNIINELNKLEIFPRRYFYPSLETLNYVEKFNNIIHSTDISKRILCLPFYDSLSFDELDKIISIINNYKV